MRPFVTRTTSALLALVTGISMVSAAGPTFYKDFQVHGFDKAIMSALGYTTGSITYFRELGSITPEQLSTRKKYEAVGCHPFYVMKDGKADESGYNCASFYCVGYTKGPKLCRDTEGKAYGGVVEINNRLSLVTINDEKKYFSDYSTADQTSSMKARIAELEPLKCKPLYLVTFDLVVGEGYECEEVGQYPYFSGNTVCIDDHRNTEGMECTIAQRADEMNIRRRALGLPLVTSSSSSSASSVSSAPSQSSSSVASALPKVTFPDVVEGKYGYTAIIDLASKGVIKGYADGTFRPKNAVNRAEFLKLLIAGVHQHKIGSDTSCFPDVRTGEWFAPYVCAAKSQSWVGGYNDGRFRPNQTIRKSEAMKIIIASLGDQLDSGAVLPKGVADNAWFTPYIRKAVELGIILEASFDPAAEVSRADTAVWVYRAAKVTASRSQ